MARIMKDLRLSPALRFFLATRGVAGVGGITYAASRGDWSGRKRLGFAAISAAVELIPIAVVVPRVIAAINRFFRLRSSLTLRTEEVMWGVMAHEAMRLLDGQRRFSGGASSWEKFAAARHTLVFQVQRESAVLPLIIETVRVIEQVKSVGIRIVGETGRMLDQGLARLTEAIPVLQAADILTTSFPYTPFYNDDRLCDWTDYLQGYPATCHRRSPPPRSDFAWQWQPSSYPWSTGEWVLRQNWEGQETRREPGGRPPPNIRKEERLPHEVARDAIHKYLLTSSRPAVVARYKDMNDVRMMTTAQKQKLLRNLGLEAHPNKASTRAGGPVDPDEYTEAKTAIEGYL